MTDHNSYIRAMVCQSILDKALNIINALQSANIELKEAYAEAVKGLRDAADELEKAGGEK